MCLNMFFSGSGQLKPLFNSDITAEHSPTSGAELLGFHVWKSHGKSYENGDFIGMFNGISWDLVGFSGMFHRV